MKTTIVIIEDSALMRRALTKIINADKSLMVVGAARDGLEGLEMVKKLVPDVVTIDINLPDMDGLTCLQHIMIESARPCIIISAYSGKDSFETFEALELGAVGFVEKPSGEISRDLDKCADDITGIIKEAVQVNMAVMVRQEAGLVVEKSRKTKVLEEMPENLIVIGVSTGGPRTLMQIIPSLPADLNAAVVIIQHMPEKFTKTFAERLNDYSVLEVREAENFDRIKNGLVYVAKGDKNLFFQRDNGEVYIVYNRPEKKDIYIPCIEKAFNSAIDIYGTKTIGVILTGMGSDGLHAMKRLYRMGGFTIAETDETAVIFGMPKEVIGHGAAVKPAPSYEIADIISKTVNKMKH